jgi:hypothetical protein
MQRNHRCVVHAGLKLVAPRHRAGGLRGICTTTLCSACSNAGALEQLLAANREFALIQQKEQVNSTNYDKWRTAVEQRIKTIIDCSTKCFDTG